MEIEDLYQKYGPMVMRRCRRLLGNEEEALDVTQDVFVRVLEHKQRLTLDHPSSLLYRIATNLCLNRIRDRRRRPESSDEETLQRIADVDRTPDSVEAKSVLQRLFRRHQGSSRVIAILHFVDGMTLEETAREVGMSVSGVRKRLRALRATLKVMEAP